MTHDILIWTLWAIFILLAIGAVTGPAMSNLALTFAAILVGFSLFLWLYHE